MTDESIKPPVPRSTTENQKLRDARREQILRAAIGVFAQRGFSAAKIAQIAAEAGLSHGLVYHYFAAKEDILAAITKLLVERMRGYLVPDGEGPFDHLVAYVERSRQCVRENIDIRRVLMHASLQGDLPADTQRQLVDHFNLVEATITQWIADAQTTGDIEAEQDPHELALALLCTIRGMSMLAPFSAELQRRFPSTATILGVLRPTLVALTRRGLASPSTLAPKRPRAATRRTGDLAHARRSRRS